MHLTSRRISKPNHQYGTSYGIFGILIAILIVSALRADIGLLRRPQRYPISDSLSAEFDWYKIHPTPDLRWFKCFDHFHCARLEVPLDYSHTEGEKAAIAMIKFQSNLSPQNSDYRGPVLFNPGGPGGSGIQYIQSLGPSFQKLLGPEYDIIGFDPRGIGQTTPSVTANFDEYERAYWGSRVPPLFNSTSDANVRSHAYWQIQGRLVDYHSKRAAQHVSTATVARDMLAINRAHGRDKLLYWGGSYGTVLGSTFAAMFPDNVERLIIDAVVDADEYYLARWTNSLSDTDKILDFFYEECANAGSACALHANSTSLVKQRMRRIFASIKASPIPVFDGKDYDIIDYSLIKTAIFRALYQPFGYLRVVIPALAALEEGDGETALELLKIYRTLQPKCNVPSRASDDRLEAGHAVMCGEGDEIRDTVPALTKHYENLSKISTFADVWTGWNRAPCSGWKVRVKDRYSGPFIANTSFPMLVIGNTLDPVTPILGAQKMAAGFNGSVLLTQNSPGHGSLSATSLCTAKYIRGYFRDGTLPPPGTVCEIVDKLFPSTDPERQEHPPLLAEDETFLQVTRSLSKTFQEFRLSHVF